MILTHDQVTKAHKDMGEICEKVENRAIREVLLALTRCAHMHILQSGETHIPLEVQNKYGAVMGEVRVFIYYCYTKFSSGINGVVFKMMDELYEANKDFFSKEDQEMMREHRYGPDGLSK